MNTWPGFLSANRCRILSVSPSIRPTRIARRIGSPSPAQATITTSKPATPTGVSEFNRDTYFRVIVGELEPSAVPRFAWSHRCDDATNRFSDLAAVFDPDEPVLLDGFAASIPKSD